MEAEALTLPVAPRRAAVASSHTFEQVYEQHRETVFRIGLRYGAGRRAFAEDVAHDVFLKLLSHLDEVDDAGAWLYRVTANIAISHLRRERSFLAFLRDVWRGDEPDDEASPHGALEGNEAAAAALAALGRLPARERVVVCMKVLDGKSQREIAEALSLSEGYVSKLLARARRRLDLEPPGGGEP